MGQFVVIISGVGGHGCSRDIKDGESVLGCQRPDCPDCIAREFARRYKRNNVGELRAELVHWPDMLEQPATGERIMYEADQGEERVIARYAIVHLGKTSVIDNLTTGIRTGSF